jgi:hypothetical protein
MDDAAFRSRYLTYDEITRTLKAWAERHPGFVRLSSLATSVEGREVWLLTIGKDPDRARPAAWIDGNMHAGEFMGSNVALAVAEALVAVHAGGDAPGLPPHVTAFLRDESLVHVAPRLSPDGAEKVLTTGAYVRSNPRDDRTGRTMPRWRPADVDGDGQARLMRVKDAAGDFVASPKEPNALLPRRVEDEGPFYSLYPEGFIDGWDGFTVPSAEDFLSDTSTDLNRNFPYQWAPEPRQAGAGRFATSEPESRGVAEFASSHPNLYAWLNLHTFGGCYIRPCGDVSDKKMNQSDLALFRQIQAWSDEHVGYPVVSGFEEFTYEPDKPLAGDLAAYAYAQRGACAMVCELWDFWRQVGFDVQRPFVKNYSVRKREDVERIAAWDREHNAGRVVGGFSPFDHPQLGPVEIGGYDPRVGVWNPPYERIAEVCDAQVRMFLRLTMLAPRLRLRATSERLGAGLARVTAVVENVGYMPTYFLDSARESPVSDPLRARLTLGDGVTVLGDATHEVGHLGGWGGYERPFTPSYARTASSPTRRRVSWLVRGAGPVNVEVASARMGVVEAAVEVL